MKVEVLKERLMIKITSIDFVDIDMKAIAKFKFGIALTATQQGKLGTAEKRVDKLTGGAISRLLASEAWKKTKPGETRSISWPSGIDAEAVHVLCMSSQSDSLETRKAGAALGKIMRHSSLLFVSGGRLNVPELAFGLALRNYAFTARKSASESTGGAATFMTNNPDKAKSALEPLLAVADGVFFTRDLVNEPANYLTTVEFSKRIKSLEETGLSVSILDQTRLAELDMNLLLAVGQGSASPSKVAIMELNGGKDEAPLALIGKGVVFDTGGISLKSATGMEEMTMDMGGAGVVVGAMRALALRKAKANVVGLVGLVENMPSGNATRPGDVVSSMKGDTVEIVNTDAEGRLVLADLLWYAQKFYKPSAIVDLATLTGAIIVCLGHENAGVFSNDDTFCNRFLEAAAAEGEGAWRMPLDKAYDKLLESNIADLKNVGGRPAGAVTAAKFLQHFVDKKTPWIHVDIAGVTRNGKGTAFAPKGPTGWGVMSLNRLVASHFENS